MIEKTTLLEFMQESVTQTISEKDLLQRLKIHSDDRHHVKRLLCELIASGDIIETSKNRLGLPERLHLVVGYLHAHQRGFAFVMPKKRGEPDIFISPDDLGNAFHGDLVVATLKRAKGGKSNEGHILRILQRGQSRIVGLYEDRGGYGFVLPEDAKLPPLYVDAEHALNAEDGQIVLAHIISYGEHRKHPEAEVVEILGLQSAPGMDEKIVIHTHGLPTAFPANVTELAKAISTQIPEETIRRRLDLRDRCTFTIDGETARDFDDAVSLERLENGNYFLGVHIADVSAYVPEEHPIDQEAYQRGTSVYFPDRAIPMFPEHLSSDVCCLREGQDRLTLSALMEFEPTGKLARYDLTPSVIRSNARLTYTIVRQILKDQDQPLRERYAALVPTLELMKDLSELLYQKRLQRGSLDFDLPEPEIVLDLQGKVENIFKAERNLAHRMIEEFMLAANETVASHLSWMQIPSVYRVHEPPNEEKLANLDEFLGTLGLRVSKGGHVHTKDIQRLLQRVQNKPTEHLVNTLTLRAMKQARYSTNNSGHFGLASTCYTHFTSPIRRYPDLMVHRILKDTWAGRDFTDEAFEQRRAYLETIADHSSIRERVAMEAERDILAIKKLRFMHEKVGDLFSGVISGVAAFGLFVELQEFFVEGLIHITSLHDDYYHYREETYSLVGERTRKTYRVGDSVRVQIVRVDLPKRQMDLMLCG